MGGAIILAFCDLLLLWLSIPLLMVFFWTILEDWDSRTLFYSNSPTSFEAVASEIVHEDKSLIFIDFHWASSAIRVVIIAYKVLHGMLFTKLPIFVPACLTTSCGVGMVQFLLQNHIT